MHPFVSVIIPTFNEEQNLTRLLDSLKTQTYAQNQFEIILVDNNSTDQTLQIAKQYDAPNLTVLSETEQQNPDAARNKALEIAKGDVYAFTDGDCLPNPDWLERGTNALENFDLLAGRIEFTFRDQPTIAELYDASNFLQHEYCVNHRGTAFTANLFVKRQVFDTLGRFRVVAGWNGDLQFTRLATSKGFKLGYDHSATIKHGARDLKELLVKVVRIGFGKGFDRPSRTEKTTKKGPLKIVGRQVQLLNLNPLFYRSYLKRHKLYVSMISFIGQWLLGFLVITLGVTSYGFGILNSSIRQKSPTTASNYN